MNATVWGQPNCKYCDMAIKLLLSKQYVVIKKTIGNGYTKKDLLAAVPGARSVPQIFLQDILVGGYDDLVKQLAK